MAVAYSANVTQTVNFETLYTVQYSYSYRALALYEYEL